MKASYWPCLAVNFGRGDEESTSHSLIQLGLESQGAPMNIRYRVELSTAERCELSTLLSAGKHPARKLKRAQILLAADTGIGDDDIAETVGVGASTVYRTKRRFVQANLEGALCEETRPGAERNPGFNPGLAGGDSLLKAAGWPRPLDAGTAGRRTGQADRTRKPFARDGAPALGGE